MKKVIMFAVAMFVCAAAFAQVRVSQGGIVTTYEKGATINIDSKDVAEVMYGNVSISIPKGKKVSITQNRAGNIIISGLNLSGVKIMGQEVKADDAAIYVVDPATKTIIRAPINNMAVAQQNAATNNQQNTQQNRNTQSTKQESENNDEGVNVEETFPEVEQYVNEIASQQAVENVEEQLSPSAPRK